MGTAASEIQTIPLDAVGGRKAPVKDDESAANVLKRRASRELVVAFMGAVGCGLPRVITECTSSLKKLGYVVHHIKLSDFIKSQIEAGSIAVDDEVSSRYLRYQAGGNALRAEHGADVLARYAVNRIGRQRLADNPNSADESKELPPVAYLIDQLKHPDEANLLRFVYRRLFYLIGVMSIEADRQSRLSDEGLDAHTVADVAKRDRKESEDHGQQLEKAFKQADYFIHHPLGDRDLVVSAQLKRFIDIIHGHNAATPTRHEHAMYLAHSTGLKSACLSRQVGASIADKSGRIIAVGANDVPQYGGGLYGNESLTDDRCMHKGYCENDAQKKKRRTNIENTVRAMIRSVAKNPEMDIDSNVVEDLIAHVYTESGVPDLIEFSRAVHAEMDALISLARDGGGSTVGGNLYTTTFPCHNCARHIIAAGLDRVYYIEPYEKSLATEAHSDAIVVLDHDYAEATDPETASAERGRAAFGRKVKFIHFSGVAPRLYPEVFQRPAGRKDNAGVFSQYAFDQSSPPEKIVREYLDSYRQFEIKVMDMFVDDFGTERGPS
jgi:deoxycytidylate deaminase